MKEVNESKAAKEQADAEAKARAEQEAAAAAAAQQAQASQSQTYSDGGSYSNRGYSYSGASPAGSGGSASSPSQSNGGSETVNNHTEPTNEPKICGYIPPAGKDVVSEASQGGDQESVQGKVVQPGQRVEYQLTTQPQLPSDLAYEVRSVSFTDSYDPYLKLDKQQGAVYRAKDLKLEDSTIVGDGEVVDIKYPSDWDTRVLKPGESIEVTGTLKGVTKTHTDRAKVTGTPLTECPVDTSAPFGDGTSDDASGSKPEAKTEGKSDDVVTIDGKDYCADTKVESATDDWNGMSVNLATTGSAVYGMAAAAAALAAAGVAIAVARRRRKAVTAGAEHATGDAQ